MNFPTSFFRTNGVAFVWIGAVFAPTLVTMGAMENKVIHLVAGICLLVLVLLSIMDGFRAFRGGLMTNFIGSAFVPIVSVIVGTVFALYKIANPS